MPCFLLIDEVVTALPFRDVKIFDFGLAKEIDQSKVLEDGTYNFTGDTGSMRYMAPEGKKLFALIEKTKDISQLNCSGPEQNIQRNC